MTWTIAISNQKGGVAKTTSCISLGACLAELGKRTLIVDFDPQVNLTLTVGFEPESLDYTIADLFEDSEQTVKPEMVLIPTGVPNLELMPADQRLVDLEFYSRTNPGYERDLLIVLEQIRSRYDYILIDCPPSMGSLTIMALTAANMALIPVQCDYFATRGLMSLLEIVKAVREHTNPGLFYALFVTMYDARPLISRKMLEQLKMNFSTDMFETIISLDTRLRESVLANEPVITYSSKSRASSQYRSLALELTQRLEAHAI